MAIIGKTIKDVDHDISIFPSCIRVSMFVSCLVCSS